MFMRIFLTLSVHLGEKSLIGTLCQFVIVSHLLSFGVFPKRPPLQYLYSTWRVFIFFTVTPLLVYSFLKTLQIDELLWNKFSCTDFLHSGQTQNEPKVLWDADLWTMVADTGTTSIQQTAGGLYLSKQEQRGFKFKGSCEVVTSLDKEKTVLYLTCFWGEVGFVTMSQWVYS